ncbi:hypothetical protein ACFYOY_08380 [Streptomyces sp. NPDC007875]|uniref:hypothetical protein n=1 Tax=Streptomyces sp. NPDC007875 TaxID=3364783 RepID=UPI0036C51727
MTLPQLNIYRYDRGGRALITLAGEIGPATAGHRLRAHAPVMDRVGTAKQGKRVDQPS